MNVAIDDGCAAYQAFGLQRADGDGDIVQHAEAFAMIRECVMSAAAEVRPYAINQGRARSGKRARDGQPRAAYERFRPRQAQPANFALRQATRYEAVIVVLRVHEKNLIT